MGFTVETAEGRALAIKAGKNNRTPVFVDLEQLAAAKGKDRIKFLKEEADRGQLSANVAQGGRGGEDAQPSSPPRSIRSSTSAARPKKARDHCVGTPILQPTDERRRTGSHYTPREPDRADRAARAGAGVRAARAERDAGADSRSQGLRSGHGLGRLPGRGLPRDRGEAGRRRGRVTRRRGRPFRRTRTRSCTRAASSRSAASTASTRTRSPPISPNCRCGSRRSRATTSSPSSIMR